MNDLGTPEQVKIVNDRSLETLYRAIVNSTGDFALILVRCNYLSLQKEMFQRLQHEHQLQIVGTPELNNNYQLQYLLPSNQELRIAIVFVSPNLTALHSALLAAVETDPQLSNPGNSSHQISAMTVFGLAYVKAIDQVLETTNQTRDQFRKYLPFPVIIWINDEVLHKMARFAPDFKSWAANSIKFQLNNDQLRHLWQETTENLFNRLLETGFQQFLSNQALGLASGCYRRQELEFARADLAEHKLSLLPENEAVWQFILGRDAYAHNYIDQALSYYQKSLDIWQQQLTLYPQRTHYKLKIGIILFHIALCYARQAHISNPNLPYWEQTKAYLTNCLNIYQEQQQHHLVAQLMIALGEILRKLQQWQELDSLLIDALKKPEISNSPNLLAQAYNLMAQLALAQSQWLEAQKKARLSLNLDAQDENRVNIHEALSLLILAQASKHLGQKQQAIEYLEEARNLAKQETEFPHRSNQYVFLVYIQLYLEILDELRHLYFEAKDYLPAFALKVEQHRFEQQCGLRAFIGACALPIPSRIADLEYTNGESKFWSCAIAASGRHQDVNRLMERLSRSDYKLTIIHGASGVGKSSLLNAGLVPALWGQILTAREGLPILINSYSDWQLTVYQALINSRSLLRNTQDSDLIPISPDTEITADTLLQELNRNIVENFLTVLIFDQFEEFFFIYSSETERRTFYQFLSKCLDLPFVKVILSLREDYLHYLLDWERFYRLETIDNNILDRKIRYYLDNLSPEFATSVIQSLANQSKLYLEEALVNRIVSDLADANGVVRPIELQVVGAQIQQEKINTLAQYLQLGSDPKNELIERSLFTIVQDCGRENEHIVWQVLFALTDEKGTRPLITKSELILSRHNEAPPPKPSGKKTRRWTDDPELAQQKLDLIFTILMGSGLIFCVREYPEDRYQLVHDYLVGPIRHQYQMYMQRVLEIRLAKNQQELVKVRKRSFQAWIIGGIMAILALTSLRLAWRAENQRKLANIASNNAELLALSSSAEALYFSNQKFDALLEALRAGKRLQNLTKTQSLPTKSDTYFKVVTALEQAIYGVKELNRFEGHKDVIGDVKFSPDGKTIASASRDQTIKLWNLDGSLKADLKGHQNYVTSLDFSYDGRFLVSGGVDNTIKIWNLQNYQLIRTIKADLTEVYGVTLSPDGQYIVARGEDKRLKIWTIEGKLIKILTGHRDAVNEAIYTPDGKLIASVGDDGNLIIWTSKGKLLQLISAHKRKINAAAFSPQGDLLVTGSDDQTVKIWKRRQNRDKFETKPLQTLLMDIGNVMTIDFSPDGKFFITGDSNNTIKLWTREGHLVETLRGHSDIISAVSFSPDGKQIVSSSFDKTVKLWQTSPKPRTILKGHQDQIRDVAWSPDGQLLVSGSKDKTVKLWTKKGELLKTLEGHQDSVYAVSFSPDGQLIASASYDGTVKIWTVQGNLLHTLTGHQDWVLDVAWSPDGQELVSASRDKTIKIWNRDGKLLQTLTGHTERVNVVVFSPDGSLLISGSDDKTIKLWQKREDGLFESQAYATLTNNSWVLDLAFAPAQKTFHNKLEFTLGSSNYDNTIIIWKLVKNNHKWELKPEKTLKGHTDSVAHLAFSPDGNLLATSTWSNDLQIWRLDDTLLKTLMGHKSRVSSLSWSPDGRAIATGSNDQTIIIWDLDLDSLVSQSCDWLESYFHNNKQIRDSDRSLCQE